MDGLYHLIAGWSAGCQLALFLGAFLIGAAVLLLGLESLGCTLRVLARGYPPAPEPPRVAVGGSPWSATVPFRPDSPLARRRPSLLRLFDPKEGA